MLQVLLEDSAMGYNCILHLIFQYLSNHNTTNLATFHEKGAIAMHKTLSSHVLHKRHQYHTTTINRNIHV